MVHGGITNTNSNITTNPTNTLDNNTNATTENSATNPTSNDSGPVQCSICNKTFTKNHQLSVHMTVHDKNRPYACEYCTYRFSTTSKLTAHMKQHIEPDETVLQTTENEQHDEDPSNTDKIQEITME